MSKISLVGPVYQAGGSELVHYSTFCSSLMVKAAKLSHISTSSVVEGVVSGINETILYQLIVLYLLLRLF